MSHTQWLVQPNIPAVVLAPMEGVTDATMRSLLTRTGNYDFCVTEFLRVNDQPLQPKIFRREMPELDHQSNTPAGVPVIAQLLGGNAERLAASAACAAAMGARGIDLNFGCPAPTVNRHDGGATLLKYPHRIEEIVRAVRDAVPSAISVSAKLRLGFDDPTAIYENARRAEQGGASWITIHGRTKTQGYTPPAYWDPIGKVRSALSIPVIANGEIFSIQDLKRCQEQSGAIHFMIGRGALSEPTLAAEIRAHLGLQLVPVINPLNLPMAHDAIGWAKIFEEFQASPKRLKQWARYLSTRHRITWWDAIKRADDSSQLITIMRALEP